VVLNVKVAGDGGCCHTGRKSCFYRYVRQDNDGPKLVMVESPR
jgi:phosphoribosyl-AMP cyclohydrolase